MVKWVRLVPSVYHKHEWSGHNVGEMRVNPGWGGKE